MWVASAWLPLPRALEIIPADGQRLVSGVVYDGFDVLVERRPYDELIIEDFHRKGRHVRKAHFESRDKIGDSCVGARCLRLSLCCRLAGFFNAALLVLRNAENAVAYLFEILDRLL